ncbi:elongation factor-2 kinase-like protein [Leishmania tarentolae]|uniref:Elongation factor-2 kinase-like protein n=1 Tax=Leishmania tarentolae TaxID=5689 RepID=A0A640KWE6_LEITA|nr:elongation factor-2 kinase-like protein [Leishmania tarentolae]
MGSERAADVRARECSDPPRGRRSVQDSALRCPYGTEGRDEPPFSKSPSPTGKLRHASSTPRSVSLCATTDNNDSSIALSEAPLLASTLHDSCKRRFCPDQVVLDSSSRHNLKQCSDHRALGRAASSPMLSSASLAPQLIKWSSGRAPHKDQQWIDSAVDAPAPTHQYSTGMKSASVPLALSNEAESRNKPQYIRKKYPIGKRTNSKSTSSSPRLRSMSPTAPTPSTQDLNPNSHGSPKRPIRAADPKGSPSAKLSGSASPSPPKSSPEPSDTMRRTSGQDAVLPKADASDPGAPPSTSTVLLNAKPAAALQSSSATAPVSSCAIWTPPLNTHEIPEHLPTDEPDVLVPAHRYVYDVKTCTWNGVDTMIRVRHPNRGVSQGTMRVCFALEELDETGRSSQMVAKMFRHNISKVVESDYFNEGEAQCICGMLADKFNKVPMPEGFERHVLSFLQCDTVRIKPSEVPEAYQHIRRGFFSYRTTDSASILFTMEPLLTGNFTKYTNNFGGVYEGFEKRRTSEEEKQRHRVLMAVEAFSHFTLVESGGSMLVCDLQGVHDFLTDPQIHTVDGKGLGMGNMGQEGIDKWMEAHVCNEVCRAMKLKPLCKGPGNFPPTAENERRVSYYQVLRRKLRSQSVEWPEEIIPLSKPLSLMSDDEQLEYAIRLSALLSE